MTLLAPVDVAIVVLYVVGTTALGAWFTGRQRVSIDYLHGLPSDGPDFAATFEGLQRHRSTLTRVRVTHSQVRDLMFGPEGQFERHLGISVAAFEVNGYQPRDELTAVTHTVVGAEVLRFSIRDDATMFSVIFRHDAAGITGR